MRRGDLATIVLPGAYGKARPALVIQSDLFVHHPSVTVLPLTTQARDAVNVRISLDPSDATGLESRSYVMVDKAHTVPREKVGYVFGRAAASDMRAVDRALLVFLGLGGG